MNHFSKLTGIALSTCFFLFSHAAVAESKHHEETHHAHREHGAHEHGTALLNVAIENNQLHIEMESPSMNIVGFEHLPKTKSQHDSIQKAVTLLNDANKLFNLDKAAGCKLHETDVDSPLIEQANDRHEHKHEHHADENSHSEFTAHYVFQCQQPNALESIQVNLFDHFKAMHEIRVQVIGKSGQAAKQLTRHNRTLTLAP